MNSLICHPSITQPPCSVEVSTRRWVPTYDPVEFTPFVALRPALGILVLAGAVLAEVFGGFGGGGGEELDFYAA